MRTNVSVAVTTNEDSLSRVSWPTQLTHRPLVGEYISSVDRKHTRKILRVEHVPPTATRAGLLVLEVGK